MTTSQNGFEEENWHNNHGSYFDMQAAAFALFSGKIDEAKSACTSPSCGVLRDNLILKAARWPSWSARVRGTTAISTSKPTTASGDWAKAGVDIWNFTLDDHSLRKGYQYIAGFINSDTPWPRKISIKWMTRKRCAISPPPHTPAGRSAVQ